MLMHNAARWAANTRMERVPTGTAAGAARAGQKEKRVAEQDPRSNCHGIQTFLEAELFSIMYMYTESTEYCIRCMRKFCFWRLHTLMNVFNYPPMPLGGD